MSMQQQSEFKLSSQTVPPISPICPTCGKEVRLTGVVPTCEGAIYEYLCSNDGDRLSWRPNRCRDLADQGDAAHTN
jgi:predicted RNA-binding Zn-ribbon protein involved in translation (DUF1610 family)